MSRPININRIRETINSSKAGAIFVPSDFYHITDPVQASVCLKRICAHKGLERVMRGYYVKPGGKKPGMAEIARAIARNRGRTAVPSGDSALYEAGLSFSSPKEWTFVCDGINRTYMVGGKTLVFRHTERIGEITGVSYETALCIQALRAVGKDKITSRHIRTLAKKIKLADKKTVFYGSQKITVWIRDCLKKIMDIASEYAPRLQKGGQKQYSNAQKIATAFGFEVKSKSEALIAAHLHMAGLEFAYENTLISWDGVPMLPDFEIKYKGDTYYWEHVGMMDDAEYVREWIMKEKIYHANFGGRVLTTDDKSDIGAQIINLLRENFNINISQGAG